MRRCPRSRRHAGRARGHFANFIAAVRSRKSADLNAEIVEGHYSSALCHLANISYRLGTNVPFSSQSRALGDSRPPTRPSRRMEQYLSKSNGLKLDGLEYRLGRTLAFDAKNEVFETAPDADAMLTRAYRKPYIVPASLS